VVSLVDVYGLAIGVCWRVWQGRGAAFCLIL